MKQSYKRQKEFFETDKNIQSKNSTSVLGSPSVILLNRLKNLRQITNAVTNELNVKFLALLMITLCRDFIA